MDVIDHAPEIETRRLMLRAPRHADAARLAELANDIGICSMTTRMPFPYGVPEARAFIDQVHDQDRTRQNTFLIEHEDEGVVGALGFHRADGQPLEMGYWIGRPYWGRGLATEAAQGALSWARKDWRRKMVVAGHFADNAASGQVLVKAGFLYTGQVQRRHSRARGGEAPTRMMIWLA
jgi:RimJ/RimL family protein N-acetyltransferase